MTSPSESSLVLIGWDFRNTPVSLRERLAFSPEKAREALARITREGVLAEGVIVSTCNRSEIYGLAAPAGGSPADAVTDFVAGFHALSRPEIAGARFGLSGGDVVRHLFRVAAGLESMVVGEDQILAQVKEALRLAASAGATRAVLHRLFEKAFAAGKRVRAETGVGLRPTSIPGVAMELAQKVYEDIDRKSFLIVGAGETASIFYDLLWSRGARTIEVVNRTHSRAAAVVARGGTARRWEELRSRLPHADVVVCAVSSPEPVLSAEDVAFALGARRGSPMLFLDLGVPRNIEPGARQVGDAFLYGVDDLQEIAARNRLERAKEIPFAEKVIEEEVGEFLGWYGALAVVPTVAALRARFEKIREESFDRELARVEGIAPGQREKVRLLAQSMVRKLLSGPTSALKDEEDPAVRIARAEAIRHLFHLDDKPSE
ncbi:MAG: glutamyl-tRNA reductase [Thermoanaerobaculia bacterium]